jgi:hypothetical protein
MPTYTVTVERTTTQTGIIEVEAANEEQAEVEAQSIANKSIEGTPALVEWELENDTVEIVSVDEET